jgi:glycine cleavage system H protein
MNYPANLLYSKEHTWLNLLPNGEAMIGITSFAQSELGEIVYVDLPQTGVAFGKDQVFGSVEAIKTTSDLFMPVTGEIISVNKKVVTNPELVNEDPFGAGWMIMIRVNEMQELDSLLKVLDYEKLTL